MQSTIGSTPMNPPATTTGTARVAIVTGGAGGIGSALGHRAAANGYSIVVADVDGEAAKRTAEALPTRDGVVHHGFGGDLASSAVNRELAQFAAAIAPIGLLANAVGISPKRNGHKVAFHEISDEDWFRVMAVNVAAPFFLVREAYRNMPTDGSASIVNVLSITARTGTGGPEGGTFSPRFPSMLVYGASKAALHNMTASLAHELAALRIRVNGVAPGFVATPMLSGTDGADALAAQVPLGRYADPSEVADAVEFLASAKASYITGACLDVNGGLHTS